MKIDRDLVSLHAFGCLVVALHDGKLLCVALALPENAATHARRLKLGSATRIRVGWAGAK